MNEQTDKVMQMLQVFLPSCDEDSNDHIPDVEIDSDDTTNNDPKTW